MSDKRQEHMLNENGENTEASPLRSLCELDTDGHCVTCSDEALPVRVLRVDAETGLALVEVKDTTEEIDVTLVDGVIPGDMLLAHGGVAIGHLGVQGASPSAGGTGASPESLPFSALSERPLEVQGAKLPAGGTGVPPESLPFSALSETSNKNDE